MVKMETRVSRITSKKTELSMETSEAMHQDSEHIAPRTAMRYAHQSSFAELSQCHSTPECYLADVLRSSI